jgi:hypothetical protein
MHPLPALYTRPGRVRRLRYCLEAAVVYVG